MIALAVLALAVAACHNSSVTPSPSSSPASPSPNPSIKTAKIKVTINGTPVPRVPVEASTPSNAVSPRPGTPFKTNHTNHNGVTRFFNLKPSKTYCWLAKLGSGLTSSECAGWAVWQSQTIILGT